LPVQLGIRSEFFSVVIVNLYRLNYLSVVATI